MVLQAEQDRVRHLLTEALPLLCRNGLSFSSEVCIEALVGITLDKNDVFLVSIKETFKSNDDETQQEKSIDVSVSKVEQGGGEEVGISPSKRRHRKRRRSKSPASATESENDDQDPEGSAGRSKIKREEVFDGSSGGDNTKSENPATELDAKHDNLSKDSMEPIIIKEEPAPTDFSSVSFDSGQNFDMTSFTETTEGSYISPGTSNALGSAHGQPLPGTSYAPLPPVLPTMHPLDGSPEVTAAGGFKEEYLRTPPQFTSPTVSATTASILTLTSPAQVVGGGGGKRSMERITDTVVDLSSTSPGPLADEEVFEVIEVIEDSNDAPSAENSVALTSHNVLAEDGGKQLKHIESEVVSGRLKPNCSSTDKKDDLNTQSTSVSNSQSGLESVVTTTSKSRKRRNGRRKKTKKSPWTKSLKKHRRKVARNPPKVNTCNVDGRSLATDEPEVTEPSAAVSDKGDDVLHCRDEEEDIGMEGSDASSDVNEEPGESMGEMSQRGKGTRATGSLVLTVENEADKTLLRERELSVTAFTEEDLIDAGECDRVHDVYNERIFYKRVVKSDLSKTGRQKKTNRVYNSLHACPFGCKELKTSFATHALSVQHRSTVPEAKEIYDMDPKSKERRHRLEILRLKANHEHNVRVLEAKEGQILIGRRRREQLFDVNDYGPCSFCFDWLELSYIRRHLRSCIVYPNEIVKESAYELKTRSIILSGAVTTKASALLLNEVYPVMGRDKIAVTAQNDPLIVALGNEWMMKNADKTVRQKYYTSGIMRLAARLKLTLNEGKDEAPELEKHMSRAHFDDICKAAVHIAAQDEDDDETLKAPSNAFKLKYDIVRMGNIKYAEALMKGDAEKKTQAGEFLDVMRRAWSETLAKHIFRRRKLNIQKPVPLPGDIRKLSSYLHDKMSSFDYSAVSFRNYKRAVILAMARLICFNRRRCGEVQATMLASYEQRLSGVDKLDKELEGELTETEKRLMRTHDVIVTTGKESRPVPMVVPPDCLRLLDFISSNRSVVGVPPENAYLFANKGAGVLRGFVALKAVADGARLRYPERVMSSQIRSYCATLTQVFDLTPEQLRSVCDYLDQTLAVHEIHHKQLNPRTERLEIAKLLLIEDLGLMHQYEGQNLEDINIDDVMRKQREQEARRMEEEEISLNLEVDDEEGSEESAPKESPITDLSDDYLPDLASAEKEQEEEKDEPSIIGRKGKKPELKSGRIYMTKEENREVLSIFKSWLYQGITPSKGQIVAGLRQSKKNGGRIHKFSVAKMLKKVSWLNNRFKHCKKPLKLI